MSQITSNLSNFFNDFKKQQNRLEKAISKDSTVNQNKTVKSGECCDAFQNRSLFYLDNNDRLGYNDLLNISDDDIVELEGNSLFDMFSNSVVSFIQDKINGDKTLQNDISDFHSAWVKLENSG